MSTETQDQAGPKAPSREYYQLCPACSVGGFPVGCGRCNHHGVMPTGIGEAQVDRLAEAATRLWWKTGDIARLRIPNPFAPHRLFIVTTVSRVPDSIGLAHESGYMKVRSLDIIRVGNIDRKDGQPC